MAAVEKPEIEVTSSVVSGAADGVEPQAQYVEVKIVGVSVGKNSHVAKVRIDLSLNRNDHHYFGQHAGVEQAVLDALNAVQGKLCHDRGDEGF